MTRLTGARAPPSRLALRDEVTVEHQIVSDGELKQAKEDQPTAPRAAPVEAEDELVEVCL